MNFNGFDEFLQDTVSSLSPNSSLQGLRKMWAVPTGPLGFDATVTLTATSSFHFMGQYISKHDPILLGWAFSSGMPSSVWSGGQSTPRSTLLPACSLQAAPQARRPKGLLPETSVSSRQLAFRAQRSCCKCLSSEESESLAAAWSSSREPRDSLFSFFLLLHNYT